MVGVVLFKETLKRVGSTGRAKFRPKKIIAKF